MKRHTDTSLAAGRVANDLHSKVLDRVSRMTISSPIPHAPPVLLTCAAKQATSLSKIGGKTIAEVPAEDIPAPRPTPRMCARHVTIGSSFDSSSPSPFPLENVSFADDDQLHVSAACSRSCSSAVIGDPVTPTPATKSGHKRQITPDNGCLTPRHPHDLQPGCEESLAEGGLLPSLTPPLLVSLAKIDDLTLRAGYHSLLECNPSAGATGLMVRPRPRKRRVVGDRGHRRGAGVFCGSSVELMAALSGDEISAPALGLPVSAVGAQRPERTSRTISCPFPEAGASAERSRRRRPIVTSGYSSFGSLPNSCANNPAMLLPQSLSAGPTAEGAQRHGGGVKSLLFPSHRLSPQHGTQGSIYDDRLARLAGEKGGCCNSESSLRDGNLPDVKMSVAMGSAFAVLDLPFALSFSVGANGDGNDCGRSCRRPRRRLRQRGRNAGGEKGVPNSACTLLEIHPRGA